eukprot:403372143
MKKTLVCLCLCFSLTVGKFLNEGYQLQQTNAEPIHPSEDDACYSNIDEVKVKKYTLNLNVDFDKTIVEGTITINFQSIVPSLTKMRLDQANLAISSIVDDQSNKLDFTIVKLDTTKYDPILGAPVEITLKHDPPLQLGQFFNLTITYATTNQDSALNWLTPEQTAGKKMPYVYVQNEPSYARSWFPSQDTPSIKVPYQATLTVKKDFNVRMSAVLQSQTPNADQGTITYTYVQNIPIPSYLVTFVAGNIVEKRLGKRTSIITEPEAMDSCATELSDVDNILGSVESYLTPYIWGTYSIVVLPPSFPFGGMENPLLTFASPTIIVGDKSQVFVATHEIAHSWTGNDVTCGNWENYWLNEGFTVFTERKISGHLHSKNFAYTEGYINNITMWSQMQSYGKDSPYTQLDPQAFNGTNPDDGEGQVSYEKGYQFLLFLETLVGEETFQEFLRHYIMKYSKQSVFDTQMKQTFIDFINSWFPLDKATNLLKQIDWDTWFYGKGLPPVIADFMNPDIYNSQQLAVSYLNGVTPKNYQDFNNYYMNQKVIFAQYFINNKDKMTKDIFNKVETDLKVSQIANLEFKQRWAVVGLYLNNVDSKTVAQNIVSSVGRLLYITPIYQALVDIGAVDLGQKWYKDNELFYSPLARGAVKKILGLKTENTDQLTSKTLDFKRFRAVRF